MTGNSQRGQPIRLAENESGQTQREVGGSGFVVRRIAKVDSAAFVRSERFSMLAKEQQFKEFRRWQAYSQQLCRDRSLVVYYDFQQRDNAPSLLPNLAGGGDRSSRWHSR